MLILPALQFVLNCAYITPVFLLSFVFGLLLMLLRGRCH